MAATASPSHKTEKMTGAAAIVRSLEELGIDLVFGLPGELFFRCMIRSINPRKSAMC